MFLTLILSALSQEKARVSKSASPSRHCLLFGSLYLSSHSNSLPPLAVNLAFVACLICNSLNLYLVPLLSCAYCLTARPKFLSKSVQPLFENMTSVTQLALSFPLLQSFSIPSG